MFLFKRKGVYYLEYIDPKTERKKRISTKKKTKKEALDFVSNYKKIIEDSTKIKPLFLEEFEKEYLGLKEKSASPRYIISIKLTFKILKNEIGNVLLQDIRYNQLETFILSTFQKSQSLASLYYRILKAAFNKSLACRRR